MGGECLVRNDGGVLVDLKFGQGSPWFGPWILLGLMVLLSFGGVSGYGGIWEETGAWLIRIGGEEWLL